MHKANSKQSMSMLSTKMKNNKQFYTDKSLVPCIYIGLIGCGRIGSFLLKKLLSLKENSEEYKIKIYVSTRRPNDIINDIISSMTDDIEIFLDNERIFSMCQIIYLCVQSHQFDNIQVEISETLKDRIESIKKKKEKIFPTVVSCMAGVPVWKLRMILGPDVNVNTTFIDPKILEKYHDVFLTDNFSFHNGKNIF